MSRYIIASEENLEHLAHYGVKGMKWRNDKKESLLDKLYYDSAARSRNRHFRAEGLFNMDDKTKMNPFREYHGTTTDGKTYDLNLFTHEYKVKSKGDRDKKWSNFSKKFKGKIPSHNKRK